MKRKIIGILVVTLLIATAVLPVIGVNNKATYKALIQKPFNSLEIDNFDDESETTEKIETISFSEHLVLEKENEYLAVNLGGTNSHSSEPGKPMLPVYIKTFTFSSAAKIKEVTCDYSMANEESITRKIIPAPEPRPHNYPYTGNRKPLVYEDEEIYGNEALFPGNLYDYNIRCGLNSKGVSTTFVTVEVNPVQYSPTRNVLYYVSDAEIRIIFNNPCIKSVSSSNIESYDMAIIAPEMFSDLLQPLINHKNNHGLNTFLKTTEEIYDEYSGIDKPEQIKYFIKNAKETMNITYVLLVGGLKSYIYAKDKDDCNQGSIDWHVPVRYTNIFMEGGAHPNEEGCISDLYYGDLYRYNETSEEWEFEDWDSNGDGILAKLTWLARDSDSLDLIPDVYVGRLACRNKIEVKIVVDKIIKYESTSPEEKPWFKKMIGIGGKTSGLIDGQPDGEFQCDIAFNYMGDLVEPVKLYASNRDTGGLCPIEEDIITSISDGAGYVIFQGHGSPILWDTIWHDGEYPYNWTGGIQVNDFLKFSNDEKLPVIIVGGCHNGLFNISMLQILLNRKDNFDYYWTYTPAPLCFSWELCVLPWGGAIASTGNTGYGFGESGELERNFFYQIGQNGSTTLGSANYGAICKYITEYSIGKLDAFCITIHQLFGDPSLKLGGYP